MHKNTAEPQMKIWRMRFTCWITKGTDIKSEYVILIAFPVENIWAVEGRGNGGMEEIA